MSDSAKNELTIRETAAFGDFALGQLPSSDHPEVETAKAAHAEAIQAHRQAAVGPQLAETGLQLAATMNRLLLAVRAEHAAEIQRLTNEARQRNGPEELASRIVRHIWSGENSEWIGARSKSHIRAAVLMALKGGQ